MTPILLIHGYSAESKESSARAIAGIYGTLPRALRDAYGNKAVVEIDLSRYVSLENGVTLDDISRGLDRALMDYPQLRTGFNAIVHSTGALVIRNWLRKFSPKPSPVRRVIYLAGANFGSGWAHLGKGQLAQWGRYVFQQGAEAGVQVLNALELGSDSTLDLHLHFIGKGNSMSEDYEVLEYVIIGTQADASWFEFPLRYAKEDGSDGVIRTSASNLNFNYIKLGPTSEALNLDWKEAQEHLANYRERKPDGTPHYEVTEISRPGVGARPEIPFGIPYECAHSGEDMGVVTGSKPRAQVLRMIQRALDTAKKDWPAVVDDYAKETVSTYFNALTLQAPPFWKKWLSEPRSQYDLHAQVVFRLRDQDGRPIPHYDIFFNSVSGEDDPSLAIAKLFEDKHVNDVSPNIITFYLRTDAFDGENWVPRIPKVNGCRLEISATEPETDNIVYLPMRFDITPEQLNLWIQGHHTTIIDVELLRLPSPEIYRIVPYP